MTAQNPFAAFIRPDLAFPRRYLHLTPARPAATGAEPGALDILPFQWACRVETAPGHVDQLGFIHLGSGPLEGEAIRALTERLCEALGREGPIIVASGADTAMLRALARRLPKLADALSAAMARLVVLEQVSGVAARPASVTEALIDELDPDALILAVPLPRDDAEALRLYDALLDVQTPRARRTGSTIALTHYGEQETQLLAEILTRLVAKLRRERDVDPGTSGPRPN